MTKTHSNVKSDGMDAANILAPFKTHGLAAPLAGGTVKARLAFATANPQPAGYS